MNEKLKFSICIPVYKGSELLKNSLDSIFRQNFDNDFEIIIGEDTPPEFVDEIKKVKSLVDSYNDPRIRFIKNEKNLGYAINLQNIVSMATGDILFLMAQDDILSKNSLQKTYDAFLLDDDIGCVTRPYFWFMDDINKPVRAVLPYDENKDSILDSKHKDHFMKIFESVGQLSGLAYRRSFLDAPFNDECFLAHIYPFASIYKKHKCVFLKDYTVAVGILSSQTRSLSSIYDLSPTESWLKMYRTIFSGEEYKQQLGWGIDHICGNNFEGLVQLKNYANPGVLWREIKIIVKNRPKNLLNIKFWFYAIGTLIIPKVILRKMVDWYKNTILSRKMTNVKIEHNFDIHN
ncbi:MAG: Abequosyltransferase RfbV [Candidatus Dependentiae bacterium ADurb.Bin246]|nr:MAG: Abequosyltransferase RfbV [Candidatus Dependentiae bacterium ADurb.Bin246]